VVENVECDERPGDECRTLLPVLSPLPSMLLLEVVRCVGMGRFIWAGGGGWLVIAVRWTGVREKKEGSGRGDDRIESIDTESHGRDKLNDLNCR